MSGMVVWLLNLFIAINLWVLGGLAWLLLLVTEGPRHLRSGHLRVIVAAHADEFGRVELKMRVPLNLLRAAVRVARIWPNGVIVDGFDVASLEPEDMDELIEALRETSVDITQPSESLKVRIFSA